jgi:hypothetical protein
MKSCVLRLVSRSALFSVLAGSIFTGYCRAEGTAIATQPQNPHPNALANVKSNHWTVRSLKSLQASQEEFKPELTPLKDRVDFLNKETQKLEFNQFSPTTKLQGQAVITIQGGGFR